MYEESIGLRARDGINAHGSLDAYLSDYRACAKLFEMYVADLLTREAAGADRREEDEATRREAPFLLWEDVDHETKEARCLTRADTGIDVTDGATTIVQCKLRSRSVTWGECATFFGSAVGYADGIYSVPWNRLLLARNASSSMSPHLRALAESRPFDRPIEMSEVAAFCTGLLSTTPIAPDSVATPARVLRDYQIDAIDLCCSETESAAYVVLPTGTGKNVIITESVRRVLAREGTRVLIFVPTIALLEQQMECLAEAWSAGSSALSLLSVAAVAVGGGHTPSASAIRDARLVVCVYNSAARVGAEQFTCVFIDEAHLARPPALYADLRDDSSSVSSISSDEDSPDQCGYDAVREATLLPSARLLSATLDVPADAPRVTRGLRDMIAAGYLRDYTLHVPVFAAGATDADLARHLVRTYRSMIVFCATRDEGRAFCAVMNALAPTAQSEAPWPMVARYIDCETPRAERRAVLAAFKTGVLAFIVNVRVLSVGFDAPIAKGVCFLRIPASQTLAVQMIGRCLGPHRDKRIAHVVLPLVAAAGEDEHQDASAKKRVLALLRVMAHTDPRFARAMANSANSHSRGGAYVSVTSERADDLEPDQPMPAEYEQCALLHEAIYNSMGQALYGAWNASLAVVFAHYTLRGRMPKQTEPGGTWVQNQRFARSTMSAERKAMLDALPWWQWDPRDDEWNATLALVVAHYALHGRMPKQNDPCGQWAHTQRCHRSMLTEERKALLDALPWWQWDPFQDAWDANLAVVVAHYTLHGRMPTKNEPGGKWVYTQRQRRATLSDDNRARVDALSWWQWDPRDDEWTASLAVVVAHYTLHGRMPTKNEPGGRWVNTQRRYRATMSDDNRARLDALPWWSWDPLQDEWNANFTGLVGFYEMHGRVPTRSEPGGVWVNTQRSRRAQLSAEHARRLDALPWWRWVVAR